MDAAFVSLRGFFVMNVQKNETTFPFPVLFLLGARARAGGSQVLGALIAKQKIPFIEISDGHVQRPPESSSILLTDELFAPKEIKLEADVTVYKPRLDVIVVASVFRDGAFGTVTVTRGGVASAAVPVTYGWRPRSEKPRGGDDQGDGWAGDAKGFVPEIAKPFKLPTDFDNRYFSGRRFDTQIGGALVVGNSVRFQQSSFDLIVTIPPAPTLKFTRNCWAITPPAMLSQGVDTVVLLAGIRHVLLTWRFVFVWEDRLALATLEVS
jgi:hypothetical protein